MVMAHRAMRRTVQELMTICKACCTIRTMRQDYTRSGTRMPAGEPMRYTGLVDALDDETLRATSVSGGVS